MRAERRFQPTARTVGDARHFVRSTLHAWAVPEGDSVLLVSELATNAVLHAQTAYTVSVIAGDTDRVRIEVRDDDPTPPLSDLPGSDDAIGGRGMRLVLGLARLWGCDLLADGKTVWFEV